MKREILLELSREVRREVKTFVTELGDDVSFNPITLRGACAVASYFLYQALAKRNQKPRIAVWETELGGHCWIELKDIVVDLTATQFGKYPNVMIEPIHKYVKRKWLHGMSPESDGSILRSDIHNEHIHSRLTRWGSQNPFIYSQQIQSLLRRL